VSLEPGSRLGAYEVTALIGVGGMGEVYRARDTTLGREVALKVLPAAFALDADRVARFEREAKTLATLSHPNIAVIHGLERAHGTCALVMELVDGLTIAERLSSGPIAADEALPIARQIAEALEAAHEKGVIHRDLKPANIKVRSDGTVKLLDFGLAKAMDPAVASSSGSHSPTITTPAMTQAGVILGTAAYMSPEQARGGQVDKRADIWAFGIVLYEMLAGRRLFDEATVSDTLASVLKSDLKFDALPPEVPSSVRRLIGRCLTRDLRRRLRDIGEARVALEDLIAHPGTEAADSVSSARASTRSAWRKALPWAITATAVVTAGIIVWTTWRQPPRSEPVMRLSSDLGADIRLNVTMGSLVLSPDGRVLVLVGSPGGNDRSQLFVRRLNQPQASALQGTEGARDPFFSPDGQWIGFFADGQLKKIPMSGGAAVALCAAPANRGGSWSDDGSIVFSPRPGDSPLFRVSSEGGTPEALTTLGAGEVTHRWPQVLPGGRALLYTTSTATGNYEDAKIVVHSLASGETTTLHRGGYFGRYVPSGHLVYISRGSLYATRFNLERLAIESPPAQILSDVTNSPGTGAAQFSISLNGSLVYVPSAGEAANPSIFWLGADGKLQPLRSVPAAYDTIRFAPDGERLAAAILNQQSDIWTYEWGRDVMSRVTSDPTLDARPVWSPDGRRIAFRSARSGIDNLYWQRADGTGEPQRLTESKVPHRPKSWHPSGKFLAYEEIGRERDVWILPVEGDDASGWRPGKPGAFLSGAFNETEPAFSPDGRWLAYASDEPGRTEVYVVPFPGPGGRLQVSTTGGSFPRWSSNGKELFYLGEDRRIMVVTYSIQETVIRADKPRAWSEVTVTGFDLHPDGKRVAVLKAPDSRTQERSADLVFIVNFFDELRRLTAE
jgi:serine/threonine-protein kinase